MGIAVAVGCARHRQRRRMRVAKWCAAAVSASPRRRALEPRVDGLARDDEPTIDPDPGVPRPPRRDGGPPVADRASLAARNQCTAARAEQLSRLRESF